MAQILVRGLDPQTVQRLKQRARARGKSLQAEVKNILEGAAKMDVAMARKLLARIRRSVGGRKFSDSATLIRHDRDR